MKYIIESWTTKTIEEALTKVTLKSTNELAPGVFSANYIELAVVGFFPDLTEEFLDAVADKLLESKLISSKDELSFE